MRRRRRRKGSGVTSARGVGGGGGRTEGPGCVHELNMQPWREVSAQCFPDLTNKPPVVCQLMKMPRTKDHRAGFAHLNEVV